MNHFHLGDEPCVGAGSQDRNVDVAQVIADEQEEGLRGRPLHPHPAADAAS